MTHEEIRKIVITEILKLCKQKQLKTLQDTANLELDLGIDSLNRVELASNLLDLFHLDDAPIEDAAQLATVGDVVAFIETIAQAKVPKK